MSDTTDTAAHAALVEVLEFIERTSIIDVPRHLAHHRNGIDDALGASLTRWYAAARLAHPVAHARRLAR